MTICKSKISLTGFQYPQLLYHVTPEYPVLAVYYLLNVNKQDLNVINQEDYTFRPFSAASVFFGTETNSYYLSLLLHQPNLLIM